MSDAAIFATVFVSIFVLRIVAATLVFYWILPENDRCPNCNAVTLRMQSRGLGTLDALVPIELVHRLRVERNASPRPGVAKAPGLKSRHSERPLPHRHRSAT